MSDWDCAVEEAKDQLGFGDEYIEDWNEVVELAKDIIQEDSKADYQNYLNSEEWKDKRRLVLMRDNYNCNDCANRAREVHHLTYDNLHTEKEIDDCISLYSRCHRNRHS